jgi:RimK family alpha-L-glutamate ligase
MAKIAVLKGDKPNDQSEAYATVQGLSEIGLDEYALLLYSQLRITIDKEVTITCGGVDLRDFDLVYIRDFQGYEFERNAVAQYLKYHNKKFLNSDVANFQHISKLTQYMTFAFNEVSIPFTVFAKDDELVTAVNELVGYPAIVKSITGNSGRDNFLVRDEQELRGVLSSNVGVKFVAQKFIPNNGDLRMIVLSDTVECIYSRMRQEGDHRNNISQGGDKQYLDLDSVDEVHKQLAVDAAKAVSRDICGVDIMLDSETGRAFVLEANFNFGIRAVPGQLSDELHGLAAFLHKQAS